MQNKIYLFFLSLAFAVSFGWAQEDADVVEYVDDGTEEVVESAAPQDEAVSQESSTEEEVYEEESDEDVAPKAVKKSKKDKKSKKKKEKKAAKKAKKKAAAKEQGSRRGGMRFGFDLANYVSVYENYETTTMWEDFGIGMSFGYFFPKYAAILSDVNLNISTSLDNSSSQYVYFSIDFPILGRYIINRHLWTEIGFHFNISMFYLGYYEDYYGDSEFTSGENFDINFANYTLGFGFSWGRCDLGLYLGFGENSDVSFGFKLILWGRGNR